MAQCGASRTCGTRLDLRHLFEAIKWLGVAYLFYLAWVLFTGEPEIRKDDLPIKGEGAKAFLSGLSISIGNPKNMLFYLTLMPSLIDMQRVTAMGWAQLVVTLLVTLIVVDLSWYSSRQRPVASFKTVALFGASTKSAASQWRWLPRLS